MKLAELTTAGFVELLGSDAPAPGGGSAAALEGALGAALTAVGSSLKLPKDTEEEKAARSAAVQRGLEGCTRPPFEMMELAVETLELTASILGKSNDSAASDLGVSALSLRAAIQGAWLNVRINIGSLKNRELAEDYRQKGEALLARALPLADRIYDTVTAAL